MLTQHRGEAPERGRVKMVVREEPFGPWLARHLNEMGLTQTELGQMVGVAQASISAYVLGRKRPSPETCAAIAKALAVPVDVVLTKAGHRPELVTDGDDELKALFEMVRQLPLDQRPAVRDYLAWQLDRARLRWKEPGRGRAQSGR